jgi:hypothetical protein
MHRAFTIFGQGLSLRRSVAISLVIVRLILAPVLLLAVYYLFEMGWIIDRIVSVDAPAATLAQQASIEMLEARRLERNFLLLRDATDVKQNEDSIKAIVATLKQIGELQPEEEDTIQSALGTVNVYQQRLASVVSSLSQQDTSPNARVETVVRNYEKNLNNLVRESNRTTRAKLLESLRDQVDSFDAQITSSLQASDPDLRQVASDLDTSSRKFFDLTAALEARNWQRVQDDHRAAQNLLHRAEWVLSIVSALTIVASIWVTLVLPRQVVKPLLNLKQAVNHVASGNYEIDLQLHGSGEVVELAKSLQKLVTRLASEKQANFEGSPSNEHSSSKTG